MVGLFDKTAANFLWFARWKTLKYKNNIYYKSDLRNFFNQISSAPKPVGRRSRKPGVDRKPRWCSFCFDLWAMIWNDFIANQGEVLFVLISEPWFCWIQMVIFWTACHWHDFDCCEGKLTVPSSWTSWRLSLRWASCKIQCEWTMVHEHRFLKAISIFRPTNISLFQKGSICQGVWTWLRSKSKRGEKFSKCCLWL